MRGVRGCWILAAVALWGCGKPVTPSAAKPEEPPSGAALARAGWSARVGSGMGLYVSARTQRIWLIDGGKAVGSYPCSTAVRGLGQVEGSRQTPLGWHVVAEKIGDGLPIGAVFRERQFTGEIWSGGVEDGHDRILTRIIWLRGTEPYLNTGPGVDSFSRYIYIHGTSGEDRLGTPASAGCIRMSNRDVIVVFDRVRTGTPVYIGAE